MFSLLYAVCSVLIHGEEGKIGNYASALLHSVTDAERRMKEVAASKRTVLSHWITSFATPGERQRDKIARGQHANVSRNFTGVEASFVFITRTRRDSFFLFPSLFFFFVRYFNPRGLIIRQDRGERRLQ